MALDTVNLLEFLEVWPGGGSNLSDPDALEHLINNLTTIINNIINQVNDNDTTITNLSGAGGGAQWQVLTQSEYGSDANVPTAFSDLVGGAVCILVTDDKQIIVGTWHNSKPLNTYVIQLLKSEYPYTVWTNLAGSSKSPTTISYENNSTTHNAANPTLYQSGDGRLHVGYYDLDTGAPQEAEFAPTDGGWVLASTQTLATTHTFNTMNLGEILASSGVTTLLWARKDRRTGPTDSIHIYRREGMSWGSDPVATYTTYYDADATNCLSLGTAQGDDCRLISMGSGYVLALWPWRGNTTDSRYTLLWTLSSDGGATWPVGACSGTNYAIGYPSTASGSVFPMPGGTPPVPEANMLGPSFGGQAFGRTWDAAYIPGTTKVGIVLWGDDAAGASHTRLPGIRYLEFDRTGNGGLGSVTTLASWVPITYQAPITGLMLSTSDGVTRVLWGQGAGATTNVGAHSLMYSRVVDGGSALTATDWTTPREVMRFADETGTPGVGYYQFTAPVSGVFTMENNEKVWPLLCCRYNMSATAYGAATAQALFTLLRVADLDRV